MRIVGEAGFRAIELELYDELLDEHRRDVTKMKDVLREFSMDCISIMAVEEKMFSLDRSIKERAISDFDGITDLIVELGSPLVTICGYMPPEIRPSGTELYVGGPPTSVAVGDDFSWRDFWTNAVDVVRQCASVAKRKGLDLAVETRANDVFSSTDAVLNLIKEAGGDNLGIILDVAHVHAGKEYLALVVPKVAPFIKLVHFSDNDGTYAYHYSPGKGNIDFPAVIRSLKQNGYDGYVVVDTSGEENIVENAVRARDYYQKIIGEVSR